MEFNRRSLLQGSGTLGLAMLLGGGASAQQNRNDTLLVVQELGPNSLDMHGVGSNQTVNGLSWNVYDRLLTYAPVTLPTARFPMIAPPWRRNWRRAGRRRPTACPAPSTCARTPPFTTARRSRPRM